MRFTIEKAGSREGEGVETREKEGLRGVSSVDV
jgi:hypothetical protein